MKLKEGFVLRKILGDAIVVADKLTDEQAHSLIGKQLQVVDASASDKNKASFTCEVCGIGEDNMVIYIDSSKLPSVLPFTPGNNDLIYSAGAGLRGRDVYSTLIFGANAYGVTEVTGGGLEHIVKQLGSGGTADPLNQRATAGWKGTKVAELLVDNYLIRMESGSTFESGKN